MVVLVSEHQTGTQGLAQLALATSRHKLFSVYVKR